MTREEAIRALRYERKTALHENKSAFDMAIKALSAEPCEDCISRQAALDKAGYTETEEGWSGRTVDVKDIESLPPVTPIQKMGHWEWVQYDYNPKLGNWHCSECRGVVVEFARKAEDGGGIPFYKYCPNCGAKMQEAEE